MTQDSNPPSDKKSRKGISWDVKAPERMQRPASWTEAPLRRWRLLLPLLLLVVVAVAGAVAWPHLRHYLPVGPDDLAGTYSFRLGKHVDTLELAPSGHYVFSYDGPGGEKAQLRSTWSHSKSEDMQYVALKDFFEPPYWVHGQRLLMESYFPVERDAQGRLRIEINAERQEYFERD